MSDSTAPNVQILTTRVAVDCVQPGLNISLETGTLTSQFIGMPGPHGRDGVDGANGIDGVNGLNGLHGIDGQDGQDGQDGVGIPSGGITGHVLSKVSAADYDTNWAAINLPLSHEITDNDDDTKVTVEQTPDNDCIIFHTEGVERVKIDALGRMGINTSAPARPLHVKSISGSMFQRIESASGSAGLELKTSGSSQLATFLDTASNLWFRNTSGVHSGHIYFNSANSVRFRVGGSGTIACEISAAGHVGIGTQSPTTPLHVDGSIRMGSVTLATLPDPALSGMGSVIHVTELATGQCIAFSDGTQWRRISDGTVLTI